MKRLFAWSLSLCLLMSGLTLSVADADYTWQDAVLYSETGVVSLYQKANGSPVGLAPSCLRVGYDSAENKGDWYRIEMGGYDDASAQYQCYVKRSELLDVDGVDYISFYQEYPEQAPIATLLADTDVFAQPGSAKKAVGHLAATLPVFVLAEVGDDAFVRLGDFSGFVPLAILEASGESGKAEFTAAEMREATVYCAPDEVVPIYSSCSDRWEAKRTCLGGETVMVVKELGDYVQIAYTAAKVNGSCGFIPARYFQNPGSAYPETPAPRILRSPVAYDRVILRESNDAKAPSIGLFFDNTPVNVLSDDGQWARVGIGELQGYVPHQCLTTDENAGEPQMLVAKESLIVHKNPSIGYVELNDKFGREAEAGAEMSLLGLDLLYNQDFGYLYVCYDGYYGYVSMTDVYPKDESHSLTAKVNVKTLRLRRAPYDGAEAIARIDKKQQVTVLIHGNQWSLIRYGTAEGYVMTKCLTFGSK